MILHPTELDLYDAVTRHLSKAHGSSLEHGMEQHKC